MSSRFRLLAVGLALTALLSGCAGGAGATETGTAPSTEPVHGGSLTFLDPTDFTGQGGFAVQNVAWGPSMVTPQLVDRLTYQNPETFEIEPWIATEWTVSDDRLTYTFTLRDDVTFSNGQALTAEAVKAVYDQRAFGDEDLGVPKMTYFSSIESTGAPDATTFIVHLSQADNSFLQATSMYAAGIVAPATVERPYDEQSQLENSYGSGPFVVTENTGTKITMAAREDYDWAPPSLEHQGRAYLDELIFMSVPEDSARTGSVVAGQADVIRGVQPFNEQVITDKDLQLIHVPVDGEVNHLVIRPENPLIAEEAVRQALLKGTDREEITATVLSENIKPATSILISNSPYYTDLSDELAYDPEGAKAELDAAGWVVGDDGIRVRDGERLSLDAWVSSYYPTSRQTMELIKAQWAEIGVELQITQPDSATFVASITEPGTPVFQGQMSQADPGILRSTHYTDKRISYSSQFDDPKLDALLDAQATAATDEERHDAVTAIQEYFIDNAYVVPLYEETQVFALGQDVHGFETDPVARTWFYNTWKDKQ